MPGSRMLYIQQDTNVPHLVTLKFRLQYQADLKADFVVPAGAIDSNTRTSEGLYTLTLNEFYPVFLGGTGTVMPAAANVATLGGLKVSIAVTDYVPATGVLTYRTGWADGNGTGAITLADVADNDWVWFELSFTRMSIAAPTGAIT